MVAETDFSNAFAADGIVPDEYGLRTVVEYRSQLYSIPKCDVSSPAARDPANDDDVDMITPVAHGEGDVGTAPRLGNGSLRQLDFAEAEFALRTLGNVLDMSGTGSVDPKYLGTLRVDRPMWLGGRARPVVVSERPVDPSSSWLDSLRGAMMTIFPASKPGRETELSLLSWHWAEDLIAIATGAHLDRLCAYNFQSNAWETSPDRIEALNGIRCIAFRPFSGRVLAIGCEAGVALLSGQNLMFLRHPGHTRIVSLDWSTDGSKLATASAADGTVRLWDIGTRKSMFVDSGGIVRFSRGKASRLLFVSNSVGSFFRLWNCETWKSERWGYLSGPVTAITWSPDGMTLLFATEGESAVHVICIGGPRADDETQVVHTELTGLPREGPGGTPVILEMDGTGERLAVAYEMPAGGVVEQDSGKEEYDQNRRFAVALYSTQLLPNFRISPVGYVSGPEKSGPPVAVKFKPKQDGNQATVLSCMWRSGEVTFAQLMFNSLRQ